MSMWTPAQLRLRKSAACLTVPLPWPRPKLPRRPLPTEGYDLGTLAGDLGKLLASAEHTSTWGGLDRSPGRRPGISRARGAARSERLPGLISDLQMVVIDGGPRAICWTHADQVNSALQKFMA